MTAIALLLAYSVQVAVIVSVGGLGLRLSRLRWPHVRLAYYQSLFVVCFVLPFIQPSSAGSGLPTRVTSSVLAAGSSNARSGLPPLALIIGSILVAGALARLGWLTLGFVRLGRLRRESVGACTLRPVLHSLGNLTGVVADVRISRHVPCPVTFGLRRPIILVPSLCEHLTIAMQQAVICHELIHVRRRDWPRVIAEEITRALLWFHPAVWWLIDQIQLSREQVVDGDVVLRLGNRRVYLDTLLSLAGARVQPSLAAVPSLIKTRHIRERVVALTEETTMSRPKVLLALALTTVALVGAGGFAACEFPMTRSDRPSTAPSDAKISGNREVFQPGDGVTLPRRLQEVRPQYTAEAMKAKVQGSVWLECLVKPDGTVGNVHVRQSLDPTFGLDQQAIEAAKQWRFSPGTRLGKPVPVLVTLEFRFTLR